MCSKLTHHLLEYSRWLLLSSAKRGGTAYVPTSPRAGETEFLVIPPAVLSHGEGKIHKENVLIG